MQIQIIKKWGHSLGIRIPLRIARELKLSEGSEVECSIADGNIILKPTKKRRKYTLKELVDTMPFYQDHEEIDFGPPVGEEIW